MAWTCWTVVEVRTESSPSTKISSLNGVVDRWVWKCPFTNDTERIKFSTYMQDLSPVTNIDDKMAAVHWNRHFVDGINIWPKLPVHFRTYIRKWERGQRSKDLFKSCKSGREKLVELNSIKPAASASAPQNHSNSIPLPAPMPQPDRQRCTISSNDCWKQCHWNSSCNGREET
eukprot:scaffold2910_cov116-Skeletonema_menzelii.AAC.2